MFNLRFKDQTINPVFSDYGDYSSYRTNFVKIEDGNLGELDRLDKETTQQNLYKFLDELPEEYEEKDRIREHIKEDFQHSNQNMSIAEYGKLIQAKADKEQHFTEGKQNYYETYNEGRQRIFRTMNKYLKAK